jgi:hypothetical protein
MTLTLLVEAFYKGARMACVAEVGVREDYGQIVVVGEWTRPVESPNWKTVGGEAALEPVFDTRVNSALCSANNLKLSHVKFRLDSCGRIELTGFTYKNGLKVKTELFVTSVEK